MADPFPKSRQLARGERRYRRRVATPKQWQAIMAEKRQGGCRICGRPKVEFHHLISRARGGDDVADNIIALCWSHHCQVTAEDPTRLRDLAERLTDAEYAYIIGKFGEGAMERLFGV